MMNSSKINQSTKKALKDEWRYELLNDMYVKSGYVELSENGKTVYCKCCKKYIAVRKLFDERYWRINSRSPYHTYNVASWKNTEKKLEQALKSHRIIRNKRISLEFTDSRSIIFQSQDTLQLQLPILILLRLMLQMITT